MVDRIKSILEYSGLNQKLFAKRVGISEASLSNVLKGRSKATLSIAQKIRSAFPRVSYAWLMEGVGEMFDEDTQTADMPETVDHVSGATYNIGMQQPVQNIPNFASSAPQSFVGSGFQPNFSSEKNVDKIRKVKEIQVFYDDGTYEVFCPKK